MKSHYLIMKIVHIACVLCCLLFVLSGTGQAENTSKVYLLNQASPPWQQLWQQARQAAQRQEKEKAAELYQKLVTEKPRIEAARWEYCQVLFSLQDYSALKKALNPLLENYPENQDYLALNGRISLAENDYAKAVTYLQKSYSLASGKEQEAILEPLVAALQKLGDAKKALPYLEQLRHSKSDDIDILRQLARATRAIDDTAKAIEYYQQLADSEYATDKDLLESIPVLEKAGRKKEVAGAQQKYLRQHPDNLPFHKSLARWYLSEKEYRLALPHFLYQAEHDATADSEVFLTIARLYRDHENRLDKALHYYEKYNETRPDRQDILAEIKGIRHSFAKSLLAITENDGADLLWQDLDRLDIDRLAIYGIIAEELEKGKKKEELIQVLQVLQKNAPNGDIYTFRLARMSAAAGDFSGAVQLLKQIKSGEFKNTSYYAELGDFARKAGLVDESIDSYMESLRMQPNHHRHRLQALRLAADAGMSDRLLSLFAPVRNGLNKEENIILAEATIEGLIVSGLLSPAREIYNQLLQQANLSTDTVARIRQHMAKSLADLGRISEAEQQLRLVMAVSKNKSGAALLLVDLLLAANETERAGQWLDALEKYKDTPGFTVETTALELRKLRLIARRNSDALAASETKNYLENLRKNSAKEEQIQPVIELLVELNLHRKDTATVKTLLQSYKGKLNSKMAAIACLAEKKSERATVSWCQPETATTWGKYAHAMQLARVANQLGLFDQAQEQCEAALKIRPVSLEARALRAQILVQRGRLSEANAHLAKLVQEYPNEEYFFQRHVAVLLEMGKLDQLRTQLDNANELISDNERRLYLARSSWLAHNTEESLACYEELLHKLTQQENAPRPQSALPLTELKKDQSFWSMLSFSEGKEISYLEQQTAPDSFISSLSAGKNELLADEFAQLRFEKIVRNEYQARKALVNRQYKTAERQYRQSLQNDQSSVALQDLAKVYERLGDYGKEAEIYTTLQDQGQDSPQLQQSIARNTMLRAPQLAVDLSRQSKSGRENAINLGKSTYGSSFKYMPSLASQLTILAEEIDYSTVTGASRDLSGRRLLAQSIFELTADTTLSGSGGFHMHDSQEGDTVLLYDLTLAHQLDPWMKGHLRIQQDIVEDSIRSLERSYLKQGYAGGIEMESPSGFTIGAEFARNRYNDRNAENLLNFWSGYTIFSEFTNLELRYDYFLEKQRDSNTAKLDAATGLLRNSMAYWSPGDYWLHQVSLTFQHLLKGFDLFEQQASHYAITLAGGYESEGSLLVTGKFDIFLELTSHFLLKGNLLFSQAEDYEEKGAFLSLMYRW